MTAAKQTIMKNTKTPAEFSQQLDLIKPAQYVVQAGRRRYFLLLWSCTKGNAGDARTTVLYLFLASCIVRFSPTLNQCLLVSCFRPSARELDPLVHILSKAVEDTTLLSLLANTIHTPAVRNLSASTTISTTTPAELTDDEVAKVSVTEKNDGWSFQIG